MANRALVDDIFTGMPLGNQGITIRIEDSDHKLKGYVVINRAYVRWYKGRLSKNKRPSREIRTDDFE